jgi:hypothetical protein
MKKTITLEFDASDWKAVRWVINCFQGCVHGAYAEYSPARVRADKLVEELHEQARRQVSAMNEDYDT